MCLDIKKGAKPKIAKKDIVVWKHIIRIGNKYVTSYREATVEFDVIIISAIVIDIYRSDIDEISEALHSFKNRKDATRQAFEFDEILVRCIIPKSSIYYIGNFSIHGHNYISYASNQLIYKEIVKYGEYDMDYT